MSEKVEIDLGEARSLFAVQGGAGSDVVLIHGALTAHFDWLESLFGPLAERNRVTAIDRPGHGRSRRPRFEGSAREQALQIAEGLDALGVRRAAIVGHSMGGLVALALAEQVPELVERLVLIAPLAMPEPRPLEHLLLAPRAIPAAGPLFSAWAEATFDPPLLKMLQRLIFAPQPVPPDWEAHYPYREILTPGAMVAEGEEAAALLPFAPSAAIDFGAVRVPALILTGTLDRIVNPAIHARPLVRALHDARLLELPGVGHMPHHVARAAVLDAMTPFLAQLEEPVPST